MKAVRTFPVKLDIEYFKKKPAFYVSYFCLNISNTSKQQRKLRWSRHLDLLDSNVTRDHKTSYKGQSPESWINNLSIDV